MADILEQVFVTVRLAHINLHICAFYLPYEKRLEHNLLEKHINSVTTVCELARSEDIIIAAGDYNQSYLVWRDGGRGYATADLAETHARLRTERASHETLLDGMAICNLRQIQTVRNANNRILEFSFLWTPTTPLFGLKSRLCSALHFKTILTQIRSTTGEQTSQRCAPTWLPWTGRPFLPARMLMMLSHSLVLSFAYICNV